MTVWGTDKLWSINQKLALSLFLSLGVGKLLLRMETMSYRFSGFINSTLATLTYKKEELKGLQATTLKIELC